jgi:hypothetical protein
MNPDTTPTPRTDALVQGGVIAHNLLEHAREMERESDEHKRYAMSIENELLPTQDIARWYQDEFGIANARAKKAEEEVSRLQQQIRNMQEILEDDVKQLTEKTNEVARLRDENKELKENSERIGVNRYERLCKAEAEVARLLDENKELKENS